MFGEDTTTTEVLDGVRLDGKHMVVTGGTGGLGIETARALAAAGAAVTITGRSQQKLDAAVATLAEQVSGASITPVMLDLASLASVAEGSEAIVKGAPIDALINNAGVMMCPLGRTTDGFEMQTGTNHLGHFAMTMQVTPRLADGARVVAVSSAAHLRGSVDVEDLNWDNRDYDKGLSYAQSKTANIWFASELQRRRPDLLALSLHPGGIITDLGRHLTEDDIKNISSGGDSGVPMKFKSVPAGAATSVWGATAPELKDHGGAYLADCQVAPAMDTVEDPRTAYAPWAYDTDGAAALWAKSVELTGVDLP